MTYLYKNREFWKVLEPIRVLQANRMGIHIFVFLSESSILKKRLYTQIRVNAVNASLWLYGSL